MKRHYLLLVTLLTFNLTQKTFSQDTISLNLFEAIELAQRQSLNAFLAKNTYLSGYWQYRSFKGEMLPSINLSTFTGNYSAGNTWINKDQAYEFRENFNSGIGIGIAQKVFATGGTLRAFSLLNRRRNFINHSTPLMYNTNPVNLSYFQPLNGYNELKWRKKLRPLEYEIEKKTFISNQQDIAQNTVEIFFDMVSAQTDLNIAKFNFANADTLYRIGSGRFEIGTITQDEKLDLELSLLNAKNRLTRAELNMQRIQTRLNSFLRLPNGSKVNCFIPEHIPSIQVDADQTLEKAIENNPDMLSFERRIIQENRNVAKARSARFNSNLNLKYGYERSYLNENELYQTPYGTNKGVSLSLEMPIIDWGKTRGEYLMAKSKREITKYSIEQNKLDFEQNVVNTAMEFNLQKDQVSIAQKANEVGQMGFEVTKQRFLIGKVDVIKLNAARQGMESARQSYIRSLKNYWNYYYAIQKLTLHNIETNEKLTADFEKIVEDQRFGN